MKLSTPEDLPAIPKRIISLVPSQTELLHYLQLEAETIGITKFCVHPADWFQNKIRIGGTKNINIPKIRSLLPHLIIANKEENEKDQVETLAGEFPVWVTDVCDLAASLQMIKDIGQLTGTVARAEKLVLDIANRFRELDLFTKELKPLNAAYLIWQNPYMSVGGDTFINDMMKRCGLNNIYERSNRYPELTIEALKERKCDVLLLSSEPFPFGEKHIQELQASLPNTKILLADGEMFSWYGSRLLLAPDYFKTLLKNIFALNR